MKNFKKTILRSDVLVPAAGVAIGVGLAILGVGLLYGSASAFWKGVGFALMLGGSLSGFNGYSVASTNSALPRVNAVPRAAQSIGHWWNTPKLYPSGDRFAPKESFLYMGINFVALAICLAGTGLAFWALANLKQF